MKPQVTEEDATLPPSPLPHDWLMYFSPGLATRNQYMNYRVSNVVSFTWLVVGWVGGGIFSNPLQSGLLHVLYQDAKKITGTP